MFAIGVAGRSALAGGLAPDVETGRTMTSSLTELKTRARLRLNLQRREAAPCAEPGAPAAGPAPRLHDCLDAVAREAGFFHWDQARRVLGGLAVPGGDMGTFWYAQGCGMLLNAWFARHEQARAALAGSPHGFVLPYRRQFMLVQAPFILELRLDPADPAWHDARHDLVAAYGGAAWHALAFRRLQAGADRST